MRKRSLILSFLIIIGVAFLTKESYVYLTKLKVEYQTEKQAAQTEQAQESGVTQAESQENLTPKQNEIGEYKSQLMFLKHDEDIITTVNENISGNLKILLSNKKSGIVKIDVSKAKEFQTDINAYWKKNNTFSTTLGLEVSKEYSNYMADVNTYLSKAIKTGQADASEMPVFPANDLDALKNQVNNVSTQLIGLGSTLSFSSNTPFDLQNSTPNNGQST